MHCLTAIEQGSSDSRAVKLSSDRWVKATEVETSSLQAVEGTLSSTNSSFRMGHTLVVGQQGTEVEQRVY
jgi:hypothetical protein